MAKKKKENKIADTPEIPEEVNEQEQISESEEISEIITEPDKIFTSSDLMHLVGSLGSKKYQ